MNVYCVVSLQGDGNNSKQKQKTGVHKHSGPDPVWNFPMKFIVDDVAAQQNRSKLKFKLKAEGMMGDKDVGVVFVSVKELLDAKGGKGSLSYSVRASTMKMKGTLNFLFNLGERFNFTAPAMEKRMGENVAAKPGMGYHAAAGENEMDRTVTANPVMGYQGAAGSSHAYPAPPPQAMGDKHQAPGQGYPGYPPQPMYGGYQPAIPQKPKKFRRRKMGMGGYGGGGGGGGGDGGGCGGGGGGCGGGGDGMGGFDGG
ncbi:PROTEIN SRC2-like protein [Salix viminalis]|uniref:PROTEIN SRC2-like protein n=1 Tax=Salix viminalis TaxID=40686 RepID=A0A9Q0ZKC9_SALVM|nr:PROTEIN SRC2-like protein [Salix viminalis]